MALTIDEFLCIALGLIILYVFIRRDTGRSKPIPGPKGWPLVGYAPYMRKGPAHEIYSDMARQYGKIFKLSIFGRNIVVLNSAELIRVAFSGNKYKAYMNDRAATFYGEHLLFGSQSIAFTKNAYGSDHGDLRKAFTRGMHVYGEGTQTFEDSVKSELLNLVDKIECYQGGYFDMLSVLRRSLTNLMSVFLSGHDLKDGDKDVNVFWDYDKLNDFFLGADVNAVMTSFPFLRHVPGKYKRSFEKIKQAKETILRRYFFEKKATYKHGQVRGLVDFLIAEQLKAQKHGRHVLFTDEKIQAMILGTVAAGIITTLSSLSSLFLCLLNHPEYQQKIQNELDGVVDKDRCPGLGDKHSCVFIEAVVLETQRYITTVPMSIPHFCKNGIEFEGFKIPSNSLIVPNVWYAHHDENAWKDPWNFRPERWLDESGALLPSDHALRKNWLPFSVGRRQCPGESLARSRIFLYVATLLQRWTFEMPPERPIPCDPRLGYFNTDLTCRPKPYMCRVVPRIAKTADGSPANGV